MKKLKFCLVFFALFISRCQTLFYLHNARSIIQMMLLFGQIFELAEAYLAIGITITKSITISPLQITYVWMSFISIIALIIFVRICEVYDKSGKEKCLNYFFS